MSQTKTKTNSDSKLRGIIQDALDEFVNSKTMFTAFDVTTKIRNEQENNGIHVFHSVVKEYVHDAFENGLTMSIGGYDRSLISIGNPPPWLYYIPGIHDPLQYKSTPTNAPIPVTPPQVHKCNTQPKKTAYTVMATFGGFTGGKR